MLNKIVIMGRLTRDPELRRTQSSTAVTSFSIACDRDFKSQSGEKEMDFIDVVACAPQRSLYVNILPRGAWRSWWAACRSVTGTTGRAASATAPRSLRTVCTLVTPGPERPKGPRLHPAAPGICRRGLTPLRKSVRRTASCRSENRRREDRSSRRAISNDEGNAFPTPPKPAVLRLSFFRMSDKIKKTVCEGMNDGA